MPVAVEQYNMDGHGHPRRASAGRATKLHAPDEYIHFIEFIHIQFGVAV